MFWIISLSSVLLLFLLWLFLFSSLFKITETSIIATSGISEVQKVKEIITNELNYKKFFIKRSNIFLFRTKRVKDILLEQIPKIKSVDIKREFPHNLIIEVKKREPVLVLCSSVCYLVDEDRVVFEESERDYLPFIFVEKDGVILDKVLEKEFDSILEINKFFEERLEIEIGRFIINNKFTVRTKDGWEVYLDLNADIKLSLLKLDLLLEKEIKSISSLEYIDLRFSKAYYK